MRPHDGPGTLPVPAPSCSISSPALHPHAACRCHVGAGGGVAARNIRRGEVFFSPPPVFFFSPRRNSSGAENPSSRSASSSHRERRRSPKERDRPPPFSFCYLFFASRGGLQLAACARTRLTVGPQRIVSTGRRGAGDGRRARGAMERALASGSSHADADPGALCVEGPSLPSGSDAPPPAHCRRRRPPPRPRRSWLWPPRQWGYSRIHSIAGDGLGRPVCADNHAAAASL